MGIRVGMVLTAIVFLAGSAIVGAQDVAASPALPGWYGVFPGINNYQRTYQAPVVDAKSKDVYSQSVRYEWMGNDFRVFKVTLARNPVFKKNYDPDVLKTEPTVTKTSVGKKTAWNWELLKPGEGSTEKANSRLIVILAEDKVLIIEATGSPLAGEWPELTGLDVEKLAAVLDNPPRNDKATLERFKAIPRGASFRDITEWAGQPSKDIGSGIHIMVYPLDDGGQVLVGTPDFSKVMYVKHKSKDGTMSDLLK